MTLTREQIEKVKHYGLHAVGFNQRSDFLIALCDLALAALPAEPVAVHTFDRPRKEGDPCDCAHPPREERIRDALKDAVDILEVLDASGKLGMAGSECLIKCRAALRASGTAQGFVSVPVEPTGAMLKAAYAACTCAECGGIGAIYKAMLAAKQSGVDHE